MSVQSESKVVYNDSLVDALAATAVVAIIVFTTVFWLGGL